MDARRIKTTNFIIKCLCLVLLGMTLSSFYIHLTNKAWVYPALIILLLVVYGFLVKKRNKLTQAEVEYWQGRDY